MQPVPPTNIRIRLDAPLESAWRESCLADLPAAAAERLLAGSRLVRVSPGEHFERDGNEPRKVGLALVVDGLFRVYRTGADGRQVTTRYVAPGGLMGLSLVLANSDADLAAMTPSSLDCESLRDSVLLELRPENFRAALLEHSSIAPALCRYLYREMIDAEETLSGDVLLPVRSRVAAHLLNLAERRERELVVHATPQTLAAAIGSVREVVSRVLGHMERTGLVERRNRHLVLTDSLRLHRVWAGESGF
jgi:CRP/FNR family transcriptional regulator